MEIATKVSVKLTEEERRKLAEAMEVLAEANIALGIWVRSNFYREIQHIVEARNLMNRLITDDLRDDDFWEKE